MTEERVNDRRAREWPESAWMTRSLRESWHKGRDAETKARAETLPHSPCCASALLCDARLREREWCWVDSLLLILLLILITALGRMGSVSLMCAAVRNAWSRADHHEVPVRPSEEAGQLGPGTRLVSLGYFSQVQRIFCAAFEVLLHFITRENMSFQFGLIAYGWYFVVF